MIHNGLTTILVAACLAAVAPTARGAQAATAGDAAAALVGDVERLIELRLTPRRETLQWERQRETMERRIALLDRERQRLSDRAAAIEREHAERKAAARETEARLAEIEAAFENAASDVDRISSRVVEAREGVPQELRSALPLLDERETDLPESLAALIQLAVELHRLDQGVHVTHLTLAAPDGTRRRFEALLLGLSQAYIVSADNRLAAHGVHTEREWVWTWNPGWAGTIRRAIRVARGDRPPRRTPLPIRLGKEEGR